MNVRPLDQKQLTEIWINANQHPSVKGGAKLKLADITVEVKVAPDGVDPIVYVARSLSEVKAPHATLAEFSGRLINIAEFQRKVGFGERLSLRNASSTHAGCGWLTKIGNFFWEIGISLSHFSRDEASERYNQILDQGIKNLNKESIGGLKEKSQAERAAALENMFAALKDPLYANVNAKVKAFRDSILKGLPKAAEAEGKKEEPKPAVAGAEGKKEEPKPAVGGAEGQKEERKPAVADAEGKKEEPKPVVADAEGKKEELKPVVASAEGQKEEPKPVVASAEGQKEEPKAAQAKPEEVKELPAQAKPVEVKEPEVKQTEIKEAPAEVKVADKAPSTALVEKKVAQFQRHANLHYGDVLTRKGLIKENWVEEALGARDNPQEKAAYLLAFVNAMTHSRQPAKYKDCAEYLLNTIEAIFLEEEASFTNDLAYLKAALNSYAEKWGQEIVEKNTILTR